MYKICCFEITYTDKLLNIFISNWAQIEIYPIEIDPSMIGVIKINIKNNNQLNL